MFTGSPNTAVIFRRGTTKRVIPGTDFKDTQPHTSEWTMLILSTQRTRENTGTFLDRPFLYAFEWQQFLQSTEHVQTQASDWLILNAPPSLDWFIYTTSSNTLHPPPPTITPCLPNNRPAHLHPPHHHLPHPQAAGKQHRHGF